MPHKTNSYVSEYKAIHFTNERFIFTRTYNTGGFFYTNEGEKKINEKTFQKIKQYLKPRL